jgi:Protein of unknown function (DUF2798)
MTIQMSIAKKYNSLLIQAIMVLIMSSIISLIIVSYNVYFGLCKGIPECFGPNFFNMWPRSFLLAFAFGIPIVLIAAPFARKMVDRIDRLRSSGNKNKQFSNENAQLEL